MAGCVAIGCTWCSPELWIKLMPVSRDIDAKCVHGGSQVED